MHITSLGPPSMITRSRTPEAGIQVGFHDDHVVVVLDVPHARRLASLLALVGAGPKADKSALDLPPAEAGEWVHALVEVLAAAAIIGARPPAYAVHVLPLRGGVREPEVSQRDVSTLGHLTPTGPAGGTAWSTSVEDAGELDDDVRAGFVCNCGWTAIDKGPALTPTFDLDVEEHTAVCQVIDLEPVDLTYITGALA